ncbi:MAG TPA: GMC family oxidoreductase, partial [Hymenobacter sp.]
MPDEEVLEEGVLSPVQPEIQDPLLRALLADEPAGATAPVDTPLEQAQAVPAPADEVDCVVIGLGAGGAPLLARLAMAGLKVVALEAGPWHQPATDFATDEKAQEYLYWNDERLAAGADPLAMGKNNSGTGVGGSTLHYTANTPRPLPADLHLNRDFGQGEDWPFGYEELEPYFEELEQFLGISGPSPYPWGPARRQGYPLAPLPLNGAAQLMVRGCAQLGISTSPAANAALSARYYQEGLGWREACTNRGFCQAGCSIGAKASMDVTFIPLAVAHGADIRPHSFVTEIERDERGRVSGVVYTHNGEQHRQRCRHLFLCGGAVETPRLLLLNELGLTSGQVGRNLMAHPGVQVFGTFEEAVRPYKGIPGGLISQDTHRPANANFVGGYLLQSLGILPVTFAGQVARGRRYWGQQLR